LSSIRAEIDASILYVALKALSAVMDEVTLKFTGDGLSVRTLDMAEVSMVDLNVPRGLFEGYDLNGAYPHVVTVRMSDLVGGGYNKKSGPFKRPRKGDMVVLEHDGGNKLSFTMKGDGRASLTLTVPVFQGDSRKACRWQLTDDSKLCPHGNSAQVTKDPSDRLCSGCEFLKDEYKELPLPKVSLTERFTASTGAVASFLASAKGCSDSVWIKPRLDGSVELLAKGEVTQMSVVLSMQEGTLVRSEVHEVKAAYGIERLLNMFQRSFGDTVEVEYARDLPLKLAYSLSAGDLFREPGQITFFIAPKIGYDEEEQKEEPEPLSPAAIAQRMQSTPEPAEEPKVEPVVEQKPPEPPMVSEVEQAKEIVREVLGPVEEPKPVVQEMPDPLAVFKRKYRKPSPL